MAVSSSSQYVDNPTDTQRHNILMNSLTRVGRPEDYENIVKLLSPPPDITNYASPGEFKNIKVGIIGGGLAGMSSAFELRKLGFDITIFEANDERIGGRVYTHYFDKEKKLYGEFGAMRIPVSHEAVWHYINLFRLNATPFIQINKVNLVYANNTRVGNDPQSKNIARILYPKYDLTTIERNVPWPQLYTSIPAFEIASLAPPVRAEILKVLPQYHPLYQYLISNSELDIFQMLGLSYGAIELITSIVPVVSAFLYSSYDEMLNEEYSQDFANPYTIAGGMVNLPLAFHTSLTSEHPLEYKNIPQNLLGKVNWKSGHWVVGIYKSDTDGRVVLKSRSRLKPEDNIEVFDYVICAIPLSTLREIEIIPYFEGRKMRAIREATYIDAQKTLFLCSERFWEKGGPSERMIGGASYTDMIIASIVYPSDHEHCEQSVGDVSQTYSSSSNCSPNESGVLTASYNLGLDAVRLGNMNPERRFELIKRQVEKVHGLPVGYLDSIVTDTKTVEWESEEWARGAFNTALPNQSRSFLYELSRPNYDNRLFLAGEHTSAKHAWMQGSISSGMMAANAVATYSKQSLHR